MPSTYTKLPLRSGGGNFAENDGHEDAIVEVIQEETVGNQLNAQNERANPISVAQAKAAAGTPVGLILDRVEVNQYENVPSALRWTFYFSNDGWFNLGTIGGTEQTIITGSFDQSVQLEKRNYPAVARTFVKALGGAFGIDSDIPIYRSIVLENIPPEPVLKWRVKTTTSLWNSNVAQDIAVRHNTIHIISGGIFLFNGATNVRKRSDDLYEVTYEWLIDPGTPFKEVASDQPDNDRRLIMPPVVASGDPALNLPGGGPSFAGDEFMRLPYHAVTLGVPDAAGAQPPFIQFQTATFDPSKYNDWTLLPGDPVNTV